MKSSDLEKSIQVSIKYSLLISTVSPDLRVLFEVTSQFYQITITIYYYHQGFIHVCLHEGQETSNVLEDKN
jgi:hypothetical protein